MITSKHRVLVLGSAGFIGMALCRALVERKFAVHAVGRSETDVQLPDLVRVRGSIEDRNLLRESVAACSTIVYCASMTTPGSSARDPELEVIGNLLPLARLLECATEFPRRKLIFLSSAGAIYGDAGTDAGESTPLQPRSYYGAGKAASEAMLHACVAGTDWSVISLRPSNLYGPGQRVSKGFAIVPTLFDRASDGRPFSIWGDGSTVRDYLYIDDLIEAIMLAVMRTPSAGFSTYNVASGQTASILQLVDACRKASGRAITVEHLPPRGVDVTCIAPDPSAFARDFGWKARVDLAAGLKRTWDWHRDSDPSHREHPKSANECA